MAALKTSVQSRAQKNSVTGAFNGLEEYKKEVAKTRSKVSDWEILLIPLTMLHTYEGNKPLRMNLIEELAESIRIIGLTDPIATVKNEDGTYTILAGHRRTKAFELLNVKYPGEGYDYIPGWVVSDQKSKDPEYLSKIWFDTNVQARQLTTPEIINMIGFYFAKVESMDPKEKIRLANRLRGKDENSTNNQGKASLINMAKYIMESSHIYDVPGWSETMLKTHIRVTQKGTQNVINLLLDYKLPLTIADEIVKEPLEIQDELVDIYFSDPINFRKNKLQRVGERPSRRVNYYVKDLKSVNTVVDTIRRVIARAEKELVTPDTESIKALSEIREAIETMKDELDEKLRRIEDAWKKEA